MTTSDQEDQAERRRVLLQDADVRANANRNGDTGTYLSHTHSEVGGRFAVTEHQTIAVQVGAVPALRSDRQHVDAHVDDAQDAKDRAELIERDAKMKAMQQMAEHSK